MYKKITIALFALFLIQLPLMTFLFGPMGEKHFSETENRYLADFPKTSFENIQNKKFMEGFDEWFSDRFFGREQWIMAKNKIETLIGRTEISGIYTEDNRMMEAWKEYDHELLNKNLNAINGFAERFPDIDMYFMLAPNAQEIYSNTLPAYAPVESQKAYIKTVYDALTNFEGTVDAYSVLNNARNEYIYYRTDHHWTSLGAYYAYTAAASKLGITPYQLSDFAIEHASNSFRGTLYSKTLDLGVTPDIVDIYTLTENAPTITLSIMDDKGGYSTHDGLYYREYLDKKDKYSTFLGTQQPIINIETGIDNGKSILVIKDSYANSFIPFLANHYSKITMIDLRFINVGLQNFIDMSEYDQALFAFNVITFSTDANPIKLSLTK